jgi:hypothetical protein
MKKALTILACLTGLVFVMGTAVQAESIYIAQTSQGSNTGANAANAHSADWFNTAGNWGTGVGKISPGDTVHLCGTFTGTAGGNMLRVQADGAANSPVTILFEPGAIMQAPYWLHVNSSGGMAGAGAIDTRSHNYITIDGGTNGVIRNTDNGSLLAYQKATMLLFLGSGSHDVTIKNLTLANAFVRPLDKSGAALDHDGTTNFEAIHGAATNLTITNNVIHDCGWCVAAGTDNLTFSFNDMYNIEHGLTSAATHLWMHDNSFHDFANWDIADGSNHHDGFHCFAGDQGNALAVYAYNNKFYGDPGQFMNQYIFLEGGQSTTKCLANGGNAYIFNNVFIDARPSGGFPSFGGLIGGQGFTNSGVFINNTGLGNNPNSGNFSVEIMYMTGARVENNASGGTGYLIAEQQATNYVAVDYNAYQYCSGYNCWSAGGAQTANFTLYKSTSGFDAHSIANIASSTYFKVDANGVPLAGSP